MLPTHIVVEGLRATPECVDSLRAEVWGLALDQRAFGPRRLVVAVADANDRLLGLAHTPRLEVPELAIGPCIQHIGAGARLAIAYCDEPVDRHGLPPDLAERFALARQAAADHGVHLVDWIACDDDCFRSTRFALGVEADDWWDAP